MTRARLGVVLGCLCCAACNLELFGADKEQPQLEPAAAAPAASGGEPAPAGTAVAEVASMADPAAAEAPSVATETVPDAAPASAEPAASPEAAPVDPNATPPSVPAEAAPPAEGAAEGGDVPAEAPPAAEGEPAMTAPDATGRSKGTAPLGTPVEPGGMECPNEVCLPLPALPEEAASMGFMISLCCTPEGECGSLAGDMPCRLIPDSDPQCPRLDLMGFEVASCCTEDGKCGLNGEAFMQKPCGSLEEAIEMFGQFIEFPQPQACTAGAAPPAP